MSNESSPRASTICEHKLMVSKLVKPGHQVWCDLSDNDAHLMHMALGLAGEVGELVDAIKRRAIYRQPLDLANVREELGDIEFYLEGIRAAVGMTRLECLEANMAKLSKRYPGYVYTDQRAKVRADK